MMNDNPGIHLHKQCYIKPLAVDLNSDNFQLGKLLNCFSSNLSNRLAAKLQHVLCRIKERKVEGVSISGLFQLDKYILYNSLLLL